MQMGRICFEARDLELHQLEAILRLFSIFQACSGWCLTWHVLTTVSCCVFLLQSEIFVYLYSIFLIFYIQSFFNASLAVLEIWWSDRSDVVVPLPFELVELGKELTVRTIIV